MPPNALPLPRVGPCSPEGLVSAEALPLGGRRPLRVYKGLAASALRAAGDTLKGKQMSDDLHGRAL